jgi:cystathionine beta-lyase/cystathionine gamma-synthase
MSETRWQIDTRLIHAGDPRPGVEGAVVLPIFQSATFGHAGEGEYDDVRYIRLNNTPNHIALANKLASLEGAESALVAASGMAAITTAILSVVGAGDHILLSRLLYGGTHSFVADELPRLGITVDLIDSERPETWAELVRPQTRAVYVETISNPTMRIPDLEAVVAFGRDRGLVTMIDNTFASPINFRPIELGFDLSLHSATKYLNGHSDIVAGAVIGRNDLIDDIRHRLNLLGGTLDPHACFLLSRGMATLALRVQRQNETAMALASLLEIRSDVASVNYPGLESHPGHKRARRLFDGYGGMLSFELVGGRDAADRFIAALEVPISAPSLGGVHSLVTRPATTSHAGMSAAQRQDVGVSDGLIRLSVGIESAIDLTADIEQALRVAG